MEQNIYSSSNNDALLKSLGPFRINLTDNSFSGFIISKNIGVGNQIIIGDIKIYGKKQIFPPVIIQTTK